ncbi:hypothetical protein DFH08DRAFT_819864 [Mycena albidolilacea]|uniref:Uncharacterized protein n=1 Tax=Mycena albidolilacea TaxID=1033008 RepID=A0AAD6ZEF8_9AGAR|nr:hypothetical protein DFH08DRAFT_819864 [Mycena albidolilacea]
MTEGAKLWNIEFRFPAQTFMSHGIKHPSGTKQRNRDWQVSLHKLLVQPSFDFGIALEQRLTEQEANSLWDEDHTEHPVDTPDSPPLPPSSSPSGLHPAPLSLSKARHKKKRQQARLSAGTPLKAVHHKRITQAKASALNIALKTTALPHSKPAWVGSHTAEDEPFDFEDVVTPQAKDRLAWRVHISSNPTQLQIAFATTPMSTVEDVPANGSTWTPVEAKKDPKSTRHAEAQERYREKNLETTRAKARERMQRLRANRTPEQILKASENRRSSDADYNEQQKNGAMDIRNAVMLAFLKDKVEGQAEKMKLAFLKDRMEGQEEKSGKAHFSCQKILTAARDSTRGLKSLKEIQAKGGEHIDEKKQGVQRGSRRRREGAEGKWWW